jgi:hypothetical protein
MRIKFRNGRVIDRGGHLQDTVEGLAKYVGITQEEMQDRIDRWESGELLTSGLIEGALHSEGTVKGNLTVHKQGEKRW